MKINQVVKTEKVVEMEVETPYYFKHKDRFYKLVNEGSIVEVDTNPTFLYVNILAPWLKATAISEGERITEEEWNMVFLNTINALYEAAGWPLTKRQRIPTRNDLETEHY